jgi:hypothetical protein
LSRGSGHQVEVTNVREKIERKCSAKLEETHTIRKLELALQNQILTPTSDSPKLHCFPK